MPTVDELRVRIIADINQFRRELKVVEEKTKQSSDEMSRSMRGFNNSIEKARGAVVGLGRGLARLAAVSGLGLLTKQAFSAADALAKTADKVGLSTDSLQELRFASDLAGVSQQTLDNSMQQFGRLVGEAAIGTGELKDTLLQYGIAVRDASGNMRSMDAVLNDVADTIRGVTSDQERLRIAFKAFGGEGGTALVNVLRDGSRGLDEMRGKAQSLGVVLDEQLIRQAEDTAEAFKTLSTQIDKQLTTALLSLGPILLQTAEGLSMLAAGARRVVDATKDLGGRSTQTLVEDLSFLDDAIEGLNLAIIKFEKTGERAKVVFSRGTLTALQTGIAPFVVETEKDLENARSNLAKLEQRARDIQKILTPRGVLPRRPKAAVQEIVITPPPTEPTPIKLPKIDTSSLRDFKDEFAAVREEIGNFSGGMDKDIRSIADSFEPAKEAMEEAAQVTASVRTSAEEYAETLGRLNELLSAGAISQETFNRASAVASESLQKQRTEFERFTDDMGDMQAQIGNAAISMYFTMEDALVGFITRGKVDFRAFVDALIEDLARLSVRIAIFEGLKAATSGGFGGGGAAAGGEITAATGGRIVGPGGPRDDKIPVRVSANEFIVSARQAQKNLPLLEAINAGRDLDFGDGGAVDPSAQRSVSMSRDESAAAEPIARRTTTPSVRPPQARAVAPLQRGGVVRGPGGPRSDSIPMMLDPGSFVVRASSVKRALPMLQRIEKGDSPVAVRDALQGGGEPTSQDDSVVTRTTRFATEGDAAGALGDQSATALTRFATEGAPPALSDESRELVTRLRTEGDAARLASGGRTVDDVVRQRTEGAVEPLRDGREVVDTQRIVANKQQVVADKPVLRRGGGVIDDLVRVRTEGAVPELRDGQEIEDKRRVTTQAQRGGRVTDDALRQRAQGAIPEPRGGREIVDTQRVIAAGAIGAQRAGGIVDDLVRQRTEGVVPTLRDGQEVVDTRRVVNETGAVGRTQSASLTQTRLKLTPRPTPSDQDQSETITTAAQAAVRGLQAGGDVEPVIPGAQPRQRDILRPAAIAAAPPPPADRSVARSVAQQSALAGRSLFGRAESDRPVSTESDQPSRPKEARPLALASGGVVVGAGRSTPTSGRVAPIVRPFQRGGAITRLVRDRVLMARDDVITEGRDKERRQVGGVVSEPRTFAQAPAVARTAQAAPTRAGGREASTERPSTTDRMVERVRDFRQRFDRFRRETIVRDRIADSPRQQRRDGGTPVLPTTVPIQPSAPDRTDAIRLQRGGMVSREAVAIIPRDRVSISNPLPRLNPAGVSNLPLTPDGIGGRAVRGAAGEPDPAAPPAFQRILRAPQQTVDATTPPLVSRGIDRSLLPVHGGAVARTAAPPTALAAGGSAQRFGERRTARGGAAPFVRALPQFQIGGRVSLGLDRPSSSGLSGVRSDGEVVGGAARLPRTAAPPDVSPDRVSFRTKITQAVQRFTDRVAIAAPQLFASGGVVDRATGGASPVAKPVAGGGRLPLMRPRLTGRVPPRPRLNVVRLQRGGRVFPVRVSVPGSTNAAVSVMHDHARALGSGGVVDQIGVTAAPRTFEASPIARLGVGVQPFQAGGVVEPRSFARGAGGANSIFTSSPTLNFNIDARGAQAGVEKQIRQALQAAAPLIIAQATKSSVDLVQRKAQQGGSFSRDVGRR